MNDTRTGGDPARASTTAFERRMQRVRATLKNQGLHVIPLNDRGAIRIVGPGVDVSAAEMRHLHPQDLAPHLTYTRMGETAHGE